MGRFAITPLDELEYEGCERLYGGKAAGLARLIVEGMAVPEGFAVPATADSPPDWSSHWLQDFEEAIEPLLAKGPVAVRSSALGEDSADRSFAGIFDTALGVPDLKHAWEAAAICIASGGKRRAMQYAGRGQPLPVGLVVQSMVDARWSGVLFSRHPLGEQPGMMIEAVPGLAAPLVSGRREPERHLVYRTGLGFIEARRVPGGPEVLYPGTAGRLAKEAWEIVRKVGHDLDLEWAIDQEGTTWWLQARPITTGRPWKPWPVERSVPEPDEGPVTVWSNFNARESLPDPLHPLTWSLWRRSILKAITRDVQGVPPNMPHADRATGFDLVGGRVYFNLNALLGSPAVGRRLPKLLRLLDRQAAEVAARLIDEEVLRPRALGGRLWKARCLLAVGLGAGGRFLPALRPRKALAAMARVGEAVRARPPIGELGEVELLIELGLMEDRDNRPLSRGLALATIGMFVFLAGDRLFRPWPRARSLLCAGAEDNPTTAVSVGIDRLIEAARPVADRLTGKDVAELRALADPEVDAWLEALDGYLAEFGHRTPGELDLATPRWADDPTMVLDLVRQGLASPAAETVDQRLTRLRQERAAVLDDAIAAAPRWKRPLLRWARRAVPVWMPMREAPKHYTLMVLHRVRSAALELGRRFAERGELRRPRDVFLLKLDEVEALARGERLKKPALVLVAMRRADVEANAARQPPDFVRSDGVPVLIPEEEPLDGALRGVGIGGGTGAGPVKRLDRPDPTLVEAGDVLVLHFADPAWTPLFPRAAAVVMEVGGAMCHAAIIARELGIPAVFGVRHARERLTDGQRVEVDGEAGLVRPLELPPPG